MKRGKNAIRILHFTKKNAKYGGQEGILPPLLRVKNAPPRTRNHAPKVGIFDKIEEMTGRKKAKEEQ